MNAKEWLKSKGILSQNIVHAENSNEGFVLHELLTEYFQWKELQKTLVEDLTQHNSLSDIVNVFVTAGEFHISHIFDFIWPTDEGQYQKYADEWENLIKQNGIESFSTQKIFPELKRNPIVANIMKITFENASTLRLFVHQADPTRLATIDFELVSSNYMKLKGIVL